MVKIKNFAGDDLLYRDVWYWRSGVGRRVGALLNRGSRGGRGGSELLYILQR